jgi:hypothetical protein
MAKASYSVRLQRNVGSSTEETVVNLEIDDAELHGEQVLNTEVFQASLMEAAKQMHETGAREVPTPGRHGIRKPMRSCTV